MFLLILARNEIVAAIHDGCWAVKFTVVCLLYIASFWYGNDFFMIGYLNLTAWIGAFFLIYQALLMLVVAYKINEQLVKNAVEDNTNCSSVILVLMTLGITAGNLYWVIQQYRQFKCGYSYTIMSFTLVGIVAMYALVLLRSRSDASILTSSIAATYCLYLQWAALSSDSDSQCNTLLGARDNAIWQITLGLAFTMVSLFVISGSTKTEKDDNLTSDMGGHMMEKQEDLENKVEPKNDVVREGREPHVFAISNATIFFQALLILSSMYYAMLCTNWGQLDIYESDYTPDPTKSNKSFWLKLVAQWIAMSMYIFSMVAPLLFPNRNYE
jgi:hypothetical protein